MYLKKEEMEKMTAFALENRHRYLNNVLGNQKHLKIKVLFPESPSNDKNTWFSHLKVSEELQKEMRSLVVKHYKEQRDLVEEVWKVKIVEEVKKINEEMSERK